MRLPTGLLLRFATNQPTGKSRLLAAGRFSENDFETAFLWGLFSGAISMIPGLFANFVDCKLSVLNGSFP